MKKALASAMASVFALSLLSAPGASAAEFSRKQMDKMGIFLSNFTECNLQNVSRRDFIENPELVVRLGICHHWVNNHKLFSQARKCGGRTLEAGRKLDPKQVEAVAARYLDLKFSRHVSVPDFGYHYDGKVYCMEPADGEMAMYVYVTSAIMNADGDIEITGSSYYPDAEEQADGDLNVKAVIRPHVYNGKDTWSLVNLSVRDKPFPD